MTLLQIDHLRTAYGAVIVNREVSLTVEENEIVTILGPNGALAVAERGYLLQHGKIVASGAIADLRDNHLMHELYLGRGRSGGPGMETVK